jgi:hypothetical protein
MNGPFFARMFHLSVPRRHQQANAKSKTTSMISSMAISTVSAVDVVGVAQFTTQPLLSSKTKKDCNGTQIDTSSVFQWCGGDKELAAWLLVP